MCQQQQLAGLFTRWILFLSPNQVSGCAGLEAKIRRRWLCQCLPTRNADVGTAEALTVSRWRRDAAIAYTCDTL